MPRRLPWWRTALAALLVAVLAGCASAPPPLPLAELRDFAPLVVAPARLAAVQATPERFSQMGGMTTAQMEDRTREFADVRVGHFMGVPSGWAGRPVKIHHRSYLHRQETRGGIVLVPGFTEGLAHYQELVHDLVANGYSVYIHDHRGQGFSTRLLPDAADGDKGHIDQFDHLVADLATFALQVQAQRAGNPRPLFALAHSMGGAVLALHLARAGSATPLAAAALVTPMFEPTIGQTGLGAGVDRAAARWCDGLSARLPFQLPGLSAQRAAGQGFDAARAAFEASSNRQDNDLSHSVPRLMRRWADRASACTDTSAPEHCGHADAKVEGPTLRWVSQACSAAREARGPGASTIARPVLLINGGQDTVVEAGAQREFCTRAPGCVGQTMPGARHGLLFETDDLRTPALAQMLGFFDCVRAGGRSCPDKP